MLIGFLKKYIFTFFLNFQHIFFRSFLTNFKFYLKESAHIHWQVSKWPTCYGSSSSRAPQSSFSHPFLLLIVPNCQSIATSPSANCRGRNCRRLRRWKMQSIVACLNWKGIEECTEKETLKLLNAWILWHNKLKINLSAFSERCAKIHNNSTTLRILQIRIFIERRKEWLNMWREGESEKRATRNNAENGRKKKWNQGKLKKVEIGESFYHLPTFGEEGK